LRNVSIGMKHAPYVNMVMSLKIEDHVGVPCQGPALQAWEVQFMGQSDRTRRRVPREMRIGFLQGVDKTQSRFLIGFRQIIIEDGLCIEVRLLPRNNRLALHCLLRLLYPLAEAFEIVLVGGFSGF
jgi:hypothetical protein